MLELLIFIAVEFQKTLKIVDKQIKAALGTPGCMGLFVSDVLSFI